MTPEQERWAEAHQILRWKGDQAPAYVAERLVALAAARDDAGVARFTAIGERLGRLLDGAVQ